MQLNFILSTLVALTSLVAARPTGCTEAQVDQILNGQISPRVCCTSQTCKRDVTDEVFDGKVKRR